MAKSEIYVNKKYHDGLQRRAEKRGVTKAAVLGELLENVGLGEEDADYKPVVLQIPKKFLEGDKAGLQHWLATRSLAIVDTLYPE